MPPVETIRCREDHCSRKARVDGLCSAHYESLRRGEMAEENRIVRTKKYVHLLQNLEVTTMTAVCKHCGPVEVYYRRDKDVYACKSARRAYQADYQLRRAYGITLEQKEDMLKKQGDMCAICSKTIDLFTAHVDHIHGTKIIRGILCGTCNQALGLFQDNEEVILSALEYLREHKP